jgi:hypothetical protein
MKVTRDEGKWTVTLNLTALLINAVKEQQEIIDSSKCREQAKLKNYYIILLVSKENGHLKNETTTTMRNNGAFSHKK